MLLRRMGGLAISMLLLQLSFSSSDLACAKHAAESGEASHHDAASQQAAAPKSDHDHGQAVAAGSNHDHAAADAEKSCEIPAQRDCCQALVSCSMTLGLTASTSAAGVAVAHFAIAPPAVDAPAYLILAPEPPPPKA